MFNTLRKTQKAARNRKKEMVSELLHNTHFTWYIFCTFVLHLIQGSLLTAHVLLPLSEAISSWRNRDQSVKRENWIEKNATGEAEAGKDSHKNVVPRWTLWGRMTRWGKRRLYARAKAEMLLWSFNRGTFFSESQNLTWQETVIQNKLTCFLTLQGGRIAEISSLKSPKTCPILFRW